LIEMTTDASSIGWGASRDGLPTGGHFIESEKEDHINVLELKAALFGLQSFCPSVTNCHILLKVDNTSANTLLLQASIRWAVSKQFQWIMSLIFGPGPLRKIIG